MAPATLSPPEDLAELLDRLGGIAPRRIRFGSGLGSATEQDVIRELESPRKRLCELVDGVLVEKEMGLAESFLAGVVFAALQDLVRSKNLGLLTLPDGTIRLWPGRVRIPDVAFFSWDRLPNRRVPTEPIPQLAPDLAIEILSRGNTSKEMELKREDYFRSGVTLVWEFDPKGRVVHVYTGLDAMSTLTVGDVLSGDPVLPGLTISVAAIFTELDRHG
ncbi:MAG TPA: Uma2 family endonuclease [Gemmataceae bacterium]|jgi:Uma2 family endonuclease|nr:Uma2 family endonuclease [Gemmataceae bacterium]